jgi:hypothetical protein
VPLTAATGSAFLTFVDPVRGPQKIDPKPAGKIDRDEACGFPPGPATRSRTVILVGSGTNTATNHRRRALLAI